MDQSASIKELALALSKAQAGFDKARKDSKNPHFKSSFANLESVWDAIRGPLSENGLSVAQLVENSAEGRHTLTTILMHSSGEFLKSTAILPTQKPGPQEIGSCLTYMKRYTLSAIVGVAETEDDDAERAEGRGKVYAPSITASKIDSPKRAIPNYATGENVPPKPSKPSTLDDFKITFGRWEGKQIKSISLGELNEYAKFIKKSSAERNGEMRDDVKKFIDAVDQLNQEQAQ